MKGTIRQQLNALRLILFVLAAITVRGIIGIASPPPYFHPALHTGLTRGPVQRACFCQDSTSRDKRASGLNSYYGKLPLSFEANQGQVDRRIRFLSRGGNYSLFLTSNEAVLALTSHSSTLPSSHPPHSLFQPSNHQPSTIFFHPSDTHSDPDTVLRMRLLGANPRPHLTGETKLPGKVNYFMSRNPGNWRTNLPTFARVLYRSLYPGVDLVYYGNEGKLEYDFVVAPHADPQQIKLGFQGVDRININGRSELELEVGGATVTMHRPVVYQEISGCRQVVAGRYFLYPTSQTRS